MRAALLFLAAIAAYGQATDDLPQITVGVGPSWNRGDAHAISANIDVAVRLGSSNAFSWSTISTPVARVPVGSAPLASTVTTGIAYVVTQTAGGAVSLVAIAQGGVNSTPSSVSLAVTGSVGLAIRIPKTKHLYFMPFVRASNPQRGTDGALVSTVLQPAAMLLFGF